ncbi:MAG: LptF/LptG family permease, partial [Saprospiraceae bacterium]|nr:LptF/LptG family permease [Saprospiraceae bacterium]
HRRTAEPISILILTLIGVAVAGRKVRGGIGLHLLFGVVTGALYIFLMKLSFTFATSTALPTLLGTWIPNIFFGALALFLIRKAQK